MTGGEAIKCRITPAGVPAPAPVVEMLIEFSRGWGRIRYQQTALGISTVNPISMLTYSAYAFRRMAESFADII